MKKIKKITALLLCVCMAVGLAACSSNAEEDKNDKKTNIVCTTFPIYDWIKNIVGEDESISIKYLLNSSTDLHNFQPSAQDIIEITNSDLFVYIGGESDDWVDDITDSSKEKKINAVNLMEVLGSNAKEEEIKEGMQAIHEEDEHDEGEPEYDEHIWLSLKNAKILCNSLTEKLCELKKEKSEQYRKNADEYISKLDSLDKEYQSVVDNAKTKAVLFGDRFPFRYLVDDYNIDYYAAFSGCSAESEASFETITFLAKKVDELQLTAVLTIESGDKKIAQTIVDNTKNKNQKILSLNSMQGSIKESDTYLSVMQNNLEVLKQALN